MLVVATLVALSSVAGRAEEKAQSSVKVHWLKEIKRPLDTGSKVMGGHEEQPPPIVYEKSQGVTNTQMLAKVNYSYIKEGVEHTETIVTGTPLGVPVLAASGMITNTEWFSMATLSLALSGVSGTGTLHIAFCEPGGTTGDQIAVGRQLSNWLDLPVSLPNLGPPAW